MDPPPAHLTRLGYGVVSCVAVLSVIGLAVIYASEQTRDGWHVNTVKQMLFGLAGIAAGAVILRTGYQRIARYAYVIFGLALLLLIPLMVARLTDFEFGGLVPGRRGAHRWIRLPGFQLQPSEFMKVAYVLALAEYLRFRKNNRTLGGVAIPIVLSLVPMLLILKEPDLGTVLLMVPVLFAMLYAAGARRRHLALILAAGIVAAPFVWERIAPYQRLRITGLLLQSESLRGSIIAHPERYRHLCSERQARQWERDLGWQLVCSKAALGSGGVFGEGWGRGTFVEYNFLPDRHNDFVFALVGHQWGLVGCLVVLLCYVVIVVAATEIASSTPDPFGRLLAVGVLALIASQVVINVGMTAGLMPITGMTLPFVSYGGSSLLTSYIAVSLLLSVARRHPFLLARKPFEYTEPSLGPRIRHRRRRGRPTSEPHRIEEETEPRR